MAEPTIQATIVNDSSSELCEAECGEDWSATETLTLVNRRIKERFGDNAQLEYINLPEATDSQHVLEIKQIIEGLPLPLLLINGHPRVSGQLDIRRLLDIL